MEQMEVAYDLNRFAVNTEKQRKVRVIKNEDKKALRRVKMKGVKMVFLVAVMLSLICSLLYSQTIETELNREIAMVQKDIVEAKSEHAYLANEIEIKANMKNIEKRAMELGLTKINPSQITYINIEKENKIVLPQSDAKKAIDGMRTGLMSFMEYIAP